MWGQADVPVERESGRLLRGTRELHGVSTIASVPLPNSGNLAGTSSYSCLYIYIMYN